MSADRGATTRAFEEAILTFEAALSKMNEALSAPPPADEAAYLDSLEALAQNVSPLLLRRQRAFNTAIVSQLRHQRTMQRALVELLSSQTRLLEFLRTIKPYVDTRDFADVLRAIADDDLKRSDALLARDRRRELELTDVKAELTEIRARLDELQRAMASSARGGASPA